MTDISDAVNRLSALHNKLCIRYGSMNEEYPEQLMAVRFISPSARVLEIGGNIGRNSCVIASILEDSANLVVMESDPQVASQLQENRDANGLKFAIEPRALSKSEMVQHGWNTYPRDTFHGGTPITTITWESFKAKYPISFDTLVLDCEGAVFYILKDFQPDFLSQINTIIIENDFVNQEHMTCVHDEFIRLGFHVEYNHSVPFSYNCREHFYQVWKRN